MRQVLAATSNTLRQLLGDTMAADVGPGGLAGFFGGTGTVSLQSPREMRDDSREGLSLWLYRVERDEQRLNEPPHSRLLPDGTLELLPTPLPLRLHYLVTPIAVTSPEMEQRILGLAMQALHRHALLSGSLLRGELAGTDTELSLHLEALGVDQIARVWEALEGSYQLCVSYEVSLVLIESAADPLRASPVETARADTSLIIEREPA